MRRSEFRRPSRHACLRVMVTARCACVRSRGPDADPGPGAFGFGSPTPIADRDGRTLSSFRGILLCLCPALGTPAGPLRQAIRRSDAAPAAATARAPTIRRLSGLNHTASALAVYASPHGSHRRTQDSLPLSANSTERDFNPQDSYERFPRRFLHRILPCMFISATCNNGGSVVRRSVIVLWLRPLRKDCSLRSLA
jgi:hypothetical protein